MAPKGKAARIRQELRQIAKRDGGRLRPAAVVDFASDPNTALHSRFEWDDTKAGRSFRLWQARHIIRVQVSVLRDGTPPFRVFVSMQEDRQQPQGGYRLTADVLSEAGSRAELLDEAKRELAVFVQKYRILSKELAPVFAAIQQVRRPRKRAKRRA